MQSSRQIDGSLALLATLHLLAVGAVFGAGYQLTIRRAARLASQTPLPDTSIGLDAWVPFWDWSIWIYLSINLAYILVFYVCRNEAQLARLSQRLIAVQLAACIFFWWHPTQMLRVAPVQESRWAQLYGWLSLFDQPFNLAPSLHVGVLVVLWAQLCSYCSGYCRVACHLWAVSVALSALVTWQHNLLDVVLGLALGFLCLLWGKIPAGN